MSVIHFLNVNDGDCSIIQHDSGRTTVIDICNGNTDTDEILTEAVNYRQKEHPVNPIQYIKDLKISTIFRFILTHPDMDHMDGIKRLFDCFEVNNFWDVANNKSMSPETYWGKYSKDDWEFYQDIRKSSDNPNVLNLLSDAVGRLYNRNENGTCGGDGLYILCPTEELVNLANKNDDYNLSSYVLLLKEHNKRIIFAGDSGEEAWNYIVENYANEVKDIDLLIAPHHGRKTGGNDTYLDILKPKLTLIGNANSKYLDYNAWLKRDLAHITNNQANCIIVDTFGKYLSVYCTNEVFARNLNKRTCWHNKYNSWYVGSY